jgi:hypothetical protein
MTTLNRSIDLYINARKPGGSPCLMIGADNSNPLQESPTWMEGSQFNLNLYFREPASDGGASTPLDLDESFAVTMSAKVKGEESGDLLVFADGFAQSEAEEFYHAPVIIPASAELLAAFGAKSSITLSVDVNYMVEDELLPFRFEVELFRRVATAGGSAAAPQPTYFMRSESGDTIWKMTINDNGQPSFTRVS